MYSKEPKLNPVNITLFYGLFAVSWIWLSDAFLHHLPLTGAVVFVIGALKGTLFVAITMFSLYFLLSRMLRQMAASRSEHESALQESEERFRAFMNHSTAIAWAKDQDGRYVYLNETYKKEFNLSLEDWQGKTDLDVWPPQVAEKFRRDDQEVLHHNRPIETKDSVSIGIGSVSTWRNIRFPFEDTQGRRYVGGLGINVTEAERVEAALRDSEEQLKLFIEHAPAALAMFDHEMRYLRASERWMSDYALGGRTIGGLSHYTVFPDIPQRWREAHRRGLAGEILRAEEDCFERADGTVQWLRWEILPWRDRDGRIGGIIIFTEDITAQKRVRAEVKQLQQEFHQAQKMEAIGRLTGGIAHDFNNLLTVILAHTELLQQSFDDERVRKRFDHISHAATQAADLTRQLLAFSRKQVLQPSIQHIGDILASMGGMLPRILGENIHLEVNAAPELSPVMVDRSQIEQVIMNLVVNARDAMPHGGRLTLDASNVRLEDVAISDGNTISSGDYVLLSVQDTGTGMTASIKQKIFEPFFTTKPPGKGTGLGLSTVFGIVKQSGGVILVHTKPGKGTCFKIYLPARTLAPSDAVVDTSISRSPDVHCSILLVDDEPAVCSVLAEYLRDAGHTVWESNSVASALQIADEQKSEIDLVITDLILREGNGKELSASLKSQGCHAATIFMSGYTDDVLEDNAALSSDVFFLQKPFGSKALLEMVQQAHASSPQS